MSENGQQDTIDIKTPFFSSKIAGKNLTLRDILLLMTFGSTVWIGSTIYNHADGAEKATQALLKEVKESNKQSAEAQRNIAYYQCRTACLLEQPQNKRDGAVCDRVCLPVKQ